jgi:hypothetical protein
MGWWIVLGLTLAAIVHAVMLYNGLVTVKNNVALAYLSQRELESKYGLWIWVHLATFIGAMGGLGWNLIS